MNSHLAWNVLQRLDAVLEARPDVVVILIGTNDILATLGPKQEASYRRFQKIPVSPTLAWYEQNVAAILDRLKPAVEHIAVLRIPPLGERLDSAENVKVRSYNETFNHLSAGRGTEVLPLFDRLAAALTPERDAPRSHSTPSRSRPSPSARMTSIAVYACPWPHPSAAPGSSSHWTSASAPPVTPGPLTINYPQQLTTESFQILGYPLARRRRPRFPITARSAPRSRRGRADAREPPTRADPWTAALRPRSCAD